MAALFTAYSALIQMLLFYVPFIPVLMLDPSQRLESYDNLDERAA
jgi:hypothetical protein